jgi:hypothetical protein
MRRIRLMLPGLLVFISLIIVIMLLKIVLASRLRLPRRTISQW